MPTSRIRLAAVKVQLVVYVDDGDTLESAKVQPVTIAASDWGAFAENGIQEALESMQKQLNIAEPAVESDG